MPVLLPETLSEHLYRTCLTTIIDEKGVERSTSERIDAVHAVQEAISQTDAYLSITGPTCRTILPTLDFVAHFRKSYCLLMWIRPRRKKISGTDRTRLVSGNDNDNDKTSNKVEDGTADLNQTNPSSFFYRIATSQDDSTAAGVCVTCSDWILVQEQDQSYLQATLTALSLPYANKVDDESSKDSAMASVRVPIKLELDQWSLVGFTHVYPYLKKPTWSVVVNGREVGIGELSYPTETMLSKSQVMMEDSILLQNIVTPALYDPVDDTSNNVSTRAEGNELETSSSATKSSQSGRLHWELDLAAISLYAEPIHATIQSLCAEAGPNLALQMVDGRIIPTLPPISNWSKGSSVEGPKVGIPLVVHQTALDLSRLSCKHIFSCSAAMARVLGTTTTGSSGGLDGGGIVATSRIVCTMYLQQGAAEETPRVGVIQPGPPLRASDDELLSLYMTGDCTLFNALESYEVAATSLTSQGVGTLMLHREWFTPNLSLALTDHVLITAATLPIFLCLCPPGKVYDRQLELYNSSIRQLYHLFSKDGALVAAIIKMLATSIRYGGARLHEQVLQSGSIHIVASCLRLGLLRATKWLIFQEDGKHSTADAFMLYIASERLVPDEEGNPPQTRQEGTAPSYIPIAIVEACVDLIDACCGPPSAKLDNLSPAMKIRRTSDLALTALYGMAFDMDLWGGCPRAASAIIKSVANRYGGECITAGYILRSQSSVQHFLDNMRLRLDAQPASSDLEETAGALSRILLSMLLSSLSNRRSIAQGENDMAACVSALSDSPLGSCTADIILNALVGTLTWCDVFPIEAAPYISEPCNDDEQKMQVASRLGRNLLVSQFHSVIAPMILSRTVFSGERMMTPRAPMQESSYTGSLCWQNHWRKTLLLFSWAASLSGTEGVVAARSCGSLLLASGLAGSLHSALDDANDVVLSTLFLPPPEMALLIGSTIRSEWSYTDLLSDRLQIMMPLVPGMIVSLLSLPTDTGDLSAVSLRTLAQILTSIGGAFHRVLGGLIQFTEASRRPSKLISDGAALALKGAKTYAPHLLVVAIVLENHILIREVPTVSDDDTSTVTWPSLSGSPKRRTDSDSWVEVSSATSDTLVNELVVSIPPDQDKFDPTAVLAILRNCQRSVMNTIAGLLSNAMSIGGAGSTVPLWKAVLSTLVEAIEYISSDGGRQMRNDEEQHATSSDTQNDNDQSSGNLLLPLARDILCRLISYVLLKILRRDSHLGTWSIEMSTAIAKVVMLIEEKGLLARAVTVSSSPSSHVSSDQNMLLCILLDILKDGREATGWCQLTLPPMPSSNDRHGSSYDYNPGMSKLLLPVLQPCLQVVLQHIDDISAETKVIGGQDGERISESSGSRLLLTEVFAELDLTLTAAIVGLALTTAKETALNAISVLRKSHKRREEDGDQKGAELCSFLLLKVEEELRVRDHDERRMRETALFDAYETDDPSLSKNAADSSYAVENLILGGDTAGLADYELVHLFDTGMSIREEVTAWKDTRRESVTAVHLPIFGSDTAADTMSTFFEFAAVEKSRLKEITTRFLPSHRFSRIAFAERFCWARFMETTHGDRDSQWERAIPDGNRDIRSHIPTVPCAPQFRRYLPKYLDNSAEQDQLLDDEAAAYILKSDGLRRTSSVSRVPSISRRPTSMPAEIEDFTKMLEDGDLEIVDITKQIITEEDEVMMTDLEVPQTQEQSLDHDEGSENTNRNSEVSERPGADTVDTDNVSRLPSQASSEFADSEFSSNLPSSEEGTDTKFHHSVTASAFSTPPDNASSSLSLMHSAAAGMIEEHIDKCLHVRAEGTRPCTILMTSSHLILEYDKDSEGLLEGEVLAVQEEAERQRMIEEDRILRERDDDSQYQQKGIRRLREVAALRPRSIRYNLSEASHVYLRRYRLRDSALEMFFIPSGGTSFGGFGAFSHTSSLFIDFGPGYEGNTRRDAAAFAIMRRAPPQTVKQWPDRSTQFLHDQLNRLTLGWVEGKVSNFDYLLHLNILSGRSYNDICQYPVFPWVLSDYDSDEIPDIMSKSSFRDLSKPVGALNPNRLADFIERFSTFSDPSIPPFMYGSHYSTSAGVVLHFLVRLHPFAGLHRQLQGGHFDVADRLFSSVPRTWAMCTGSSAAEVKELTPEWYCNPSFLKNTNKFKLGSSQDGELLGDVMLPPWANGSPEKFVEVLRSALESHICAEMLPDWIDLIFGYKQQGPEAIKANNVFFYLTYYGSVDVARIKDEALRQATELQIAHFGQCPMQLFKHRPHVRRIPQEIHQLSFFQLLSSHGHSIFVSRPQLLPFSSSPLSHWVHLDAPPPGPHAPLMALRFAGTDRCLAIDTKGIFHTFRWTWRADEKIDENLAYDGINDAGCFVAQREYPRFRSVPRLIRNPRDGEIIASAISKTLFASRSVLLVLSDADGRGGFGMQLVDPVKGQVKGETVVPYVHSARISCIATDPVGTAAGQGGLGGELALVGSADGNASLWRFMSSHFLPLRPRLQMSGHSGSALVAVALCSSTQIAATLSLRLCCLHSLANGTLIRSIRPPTGLFDIQESDGTTVKTTFAASPALAVSVQGFIVTVCETVINTATGMTRKVTSLHLFSVEGVSLGSMPLESWRGLPHKMCCIPDGSSVMVCCGRGVTIHRLSAFRPLEIIEEWQITDSEDFELFESFPAAWDIDLGPSLNRPVVAAAACSNGALRLHALPGISEWSERHRKGPLSQTVGTALSRPARRIQSAMRDGIGLGRQLAVMGRDIGREVTSDVKERGVGGFLSSMFGKRATNSDADRHQQAVDNSEHAD